MPLLLLTLLVVGTAQQAPFEASLIAGRSDSMSISLVRSGTPTVVGELWDEIAMVSDNGAPALRRVYRTRNAVFGPVLETTLVRLPDLRLIRDVTRSTLASDSVQVWGDSVFGWRSSAGSSVPVRRKLESALIEGSWFDALVRGSPLAEGFALTRQAYIASQDTIGTLSARVIGIADITQRDGASRSCFVVDMDFMGLKSTLWIDRSTRTLVRQVIVLRADIQMLMQR